MKKINFLSILLLVAIITGCSKDEITQMEISSNTEGKIPNIILSPIVELQKIDGNKFYFYINLNPTSPSNEFLDEAIEYRVIGTKWITGPTHTCGGNGGDYSGMSPQFVISTANCQPNVSGLEVTIYYDVEIDVYYKDEKITSGYCFYNNTIVLP